MIARIFNLEDESTVVQLIRYTFIGIIAISVDFYILYSLKEIFGLNYLISAAMANFIGITTNYYLCSLLVFNKKTLNNAWLEFGIFLLTGMLGIIPFIILMSFFTEFCHIYYLISKIISTAIVSFGIFFIRKHFLYSSKENSWAEEKEELENI